METYCKSLSLWIEILAAVLLLVLVAPAGQLAHGVSLFGLLSMAVLMAKGVER